MNDNPNYDNYDDNDDCDYYALMVGTLHIQVMLLRCGLILFLDNVRSIDKVVIFLVISFLFFPPSYPILQCDIDLIDHSS